jgi:hypothetical protein
VYSWGVRVYERRNGTREGRTEIRTKIACGILETKPLSQSVSFRHHVLCDLPLKLSECEWKGVAKICLFIHNSGAIEAIETYIAEDNCPCTETFSSGIPDCNKNRNTPTLKPIPYTTFLVTFGFEITKTDSASSLSHNSHAILVEFGLPLPSLFIRLVSIITAFP